MKQNHQNHYSQTGSRPAGDFNVEEMVRDALNYAREAVSQAGLTADMSNGWFETAANHAPRSRTKSAPLTKLGATIEETDSSIRIKLPFSEGMHPRHYRFFITTRSFTWTGKQQEHPQTVQLPAFVEKRTAKAVFKNGIMHVQIQKTKPDDTAHEIYVRYLDES